MSVRRLLVATRNRGKVNELRRLLAGLPVELVLPDEAGAADLVVEETGDTFAANAELKALAYARATGRLALADDSGLEVDALGGRPGVRSARFAGEAANDAANNSRLVAELRALGAPEPLRARFRCALVLATPEGQTRLVEGTCEGTITLEPRGSQGFGYDPHFVVGDGPRTMAELSHEEKNVVSHRGRAYAALRPALHELLGHAPRA
jgi:XTP/dITP diphosphohydrolase